MLSLFWKDEVGEPSFKVGILGRAPKEIVVESESERERDHQSKKREKETNLPIDRVRAFIRPKTRDAIAWWPSRCA